MFLKNASEVGLVLSEPKQFYCFEVFNWSWSEVAYVPWICCNLVDRLIDWNR